MKIKVSCIDKYEAQKLSSLLFIKDTSETFITLILNVIDNEIIVALKDKSAHSIVLKDKSNVDVFIDFIQSVLDKKHKIVFTEICEHDIEIVKA
ncbi:MAG: hypothetical protein ITD33_00205 [Nitrosarchaeum sp.]|jgi:hypothetical protein|nr:hypothetical protein [Nitrosarchaeum sp.]MBP0119281.1 hypothetical protein [Nitrosarchaeum sp.]MBP0133907.1 hypothetical protein [Nitrosarchaeum sp.]MDW7641921.1 hypothetical protein [Nitrosarchaeum sp.]MSV26757.1 hypothetical protein [Nitrosarchaeum sp.]